VPFGVTYEKIGTIQRRLAWPLHKDDTLSRSGRSTDLNIYFIHSSSKSTLMQFSTWTITLTRRAFVRQTLWQVEKD
ncbi:uncharacterized protein BT62DRAFT_890575, partial [Guyanagaster necrorhizus]